MSRATPPYRNAITSISLTPFKLKTASVPSSARLYQVVPLNEDLRNELEGANIQEPPSLLFKKKQATHYVLHFFSELQLLEPNLRLPSPTELHIQDSHGKKTFLYDANLGGWQPSRLPHILRLSGGRSQKSTNLPGQSLPSAASSEGRHKKSTRSVTLRRKVEVPDEGAVTEIEEGIYLPKPGSEETRTATWLNLITAALHSSREVQPLPGPQTRAKTRKIADIRRRWSAEFASKPMPTPLDMKMKPDISLLQADPFDPHGSDSWRNVVSFVELSSTRDSSRMAKQITRKAYAIFVAQPGRRFVVALSISDAHFRIHVFDRAGAVHSRPYCIHKDAAYFLCVLYTLVFAPPQVVGYDPTIHYSSAFQRSIHYRVPATIRVGDTIYTIIRIIFCSEVIRGRATLCFVVIEVDEKTRELPGRRARLLRGTQLPKQYVVKSSWTRVGRTTTEEQMLLRIKERGLRHGVPVLVKAWTVEIDGVEDSTSLRRPDYLPRDSLLDGCLEVRIQRCILLEIVGSPLEGFSCIQELLSVLIDIVDIHEQLVIRCNVLHRDISIKNILMYIYTGNEPWPIWSSDEILRSRLSKREVIIQERKFRRGLIIDFDYSKFTDEDSPVSEGERTGTIPFMALEILRAFASDAPTDVTHRPKHDLESIVYVLVWICVLYSNPNSPEQPRDPHKTCLSSWASCKTSGDVERLWSTKTGELVTQVPLQHFTPYFNRLKSHVSKLYRVIATDSLDYPILRETLLDAFFAVQESNQKIGVVPAKRTMNPVVEVHTTKRVRRQQL